MLWKGFQKPKRLAVDTSTLTDKYGIFWAQPFERGFGTTIGNALRPLEYAVVSTLEERLYEVLDGHAFRAPVTVDAKWDGVELTPAHWLLRFRDEVASRVVVGVYRATLWAPPQLFYAHVDHADVAARIALADSMFQDQRGFPLLKRVLPPAGRAMSVASYRYLSRSP